MLVPNLGSLIGLVILSWTHKTCSTKCSRVAILREFLLLFNLKTYWWLHDVNRASYDSLNMIFPEYFVAANNVLVNPRFLSLCVLCFHLAICGGRQRDEMTDDCADISVVIIFRRPRSAYLGKTVVMHGIVSGEWWRWFGDWRYGIMKYIIHSLRFGICLLLLKPGSSGVDV